jgi:predicted CxxxxCH...CXXCH cytochrome family protein
MNMRTCLTTACTLISALVFGGCSELNSDLPAPRASTGQVHESGWMTQNSPEFHGNVLKVNQYNSTACRNCHGGTFEGGKSGVACTKCHAGYPHPAGWNEPTASAFHGKSLKATNWNLNACTPCHAPTFQGGTSGVSCFTCHASYPHGIGWVSNSTGTHALFIASNSWDMRPCRQCHGTDYAGGATGSSCKTCHTGTQGPENCMTCHGTTNNAPPHDTRGNTTVSARGVGAHQVHVVGPLKYAAVPVPCTDCHTVPGSVYDAGHVDSALPAEVPMASVLARTATSGYVPNPTLVATSATTVTCQNTYCHGAFRLRINPGYEFGFSDSIMVGAFKAPSWTGGSAETACGSCHGLPPPGHLQVPLTMCTGCHGDVMDANGNLSNKSKHMNGKISMSDHFGGELDWPR